MRKALILFLCIGFFSCKKEQEENPYDLIQNPNDTSGTHHTVPDPNSLAGIHQNIFEPTCANSGCHDGTFEPDFRTPESTYNTLVLRPIIKNDPAGTYTYRVVPGDYLNSVLYQRLIIDIDGQSGIMPLVLEPSSDWNSKQAQYIENVKNWIQNGAKDIFGNSAANFNLPPQLLGIFISETGSTQAFPRNATSGSIQIPIGTSSIDIWLAIEDDQTTIDQLSYLKAKVGASMNDFSAVSEQNLQLVNEVMETGYSGNQVSFRFKFTLPLSGLTPVQPWFIRAYIQDATASPSELPSTGSAEYIKHFYSFQLGE
ncbi:MAG TPA: hypothetical protein PL185_04745 [Flavobacteriales bacterium]|nr:hypothetical protein [Flavobacteriales bacterium]HPH81853.1 hypothetical protein [Flavobacteriales bacterium]